MDRIALVTGAGSGIGRAGAIRPRQASLRGMVCARRAATAMGRAGSIRLSRAGLRVMLAARGADALAATAAACPGPTLAYPTDVTDPAAVDRLFGPGGHDW